MCAGVCAGMCVCADTCVCVCLGEGWRGLSFIGLKWTKITLSSLIHCLQGGSQFSALGEGMKCSERWYIILLYCILSVCCGLFVFLDWLWCFLCLFSCDVLAAGTTGQPLGMIQSKLLLLMLRPWPCCKARGFLRNAFGTTFVMEK